MAYRTGQNEYINKRRKELEAQQEQRANRQLKAQMQVNDINAGFQQIQMQHQQGMQRAAVQNEFQLDRDEKNHNWQVNAAGDLFNRQKELSDINHGYGLDRAEFTNNLQDQTMIRNNQSLQMDKTLNTMYSQSNEQGRELIDNWRGQMAKLYSHVGEGKIDEQQYRASYNEGLSNIMSQLTGDQSSVYRIGAEFLPGGTSVMYGGAIKRTIGQNGESIYERNYEVDPATGQPINEDAWDEKYGNVRKAGPDDKVGYYYEYDMQTGERRRVSNLPEWQASQRVQLDAIKFQAEQQQAAAAAQAPTGADSIKLANEAVAQITTAYESSARPRPEFILGSGQQPADVQAAQKVWDDGLLAFKKRKLTREQQVALGLMEPGEGLGQADHLKPSAPKGVDKFGTPAERARNEPDFRGLPTDTNALPPGVPGSTMAPAPDELDQFLMEQDTLDLRDHFYSRLAQDGRLIIGERLDELNALLRAKGMEPKTAQDLLGMPPDNYKSFLDSVFDADEGPRPAGNEGAAFNNKLNFLESMS
jgi:hypothetical protein